VHELAAATSWAPASRRLVASSTTGPPLVATVVEVVAAPTPATASTRDEALAAPVFESQVPQSLHRSNLA